MYRSINLRRPLLVANSRKVHTLVVDFASEIETHIDRTDLRSGTSLHGRLIVNGLAHRTIIATKLVTFYVICNKSADARQVFDEIHKTNLRRWIALIGAYGRSKFHRPALDAFCEMRREGLKYDVFIVPSALKACGHLQERWVGGNVHAAIVKCCFEFDAFVVSALIDMYSKTGQVEKARRVFDEAPEKGLVAMNALVSGYAQHGTPKEAFSLVSKMEIEGVKPNIVTWNSLLAGFSQKGNEAMVSEILDLMCDKGIEPDVVSWTSVISGFVKNFRNKEAFDVFKQMLGHGLRPNSAAISSLLSACSAVANVKLGKEIHGYALVIGIEQDVFVKSALVDMYGKSGFIDEASSLFFKMSERNTATWNSMIFGYANNGHCDEAVQLFSRMMKEEPENLDHLTFTAVLTACSHARLIDLGLSIFRDMQESYKIVPRLEHYACLVDLLGRAGKLAEAYEMITAMPIKPDLFVWGALLGACKNHGNLDLAEIAAKHLAELEPEGVANKKLLSSLHADAGNWGSVAKIKKSTNKKKMRKVAGTSWTETM